jgi:two-component system response regulator
MIILVADDDADDRALALDAFNENGITHELQFVQDGEELLEYLRREGRYAAPASAPHPAVVLLDLNMPRMDGREALAIIKADPALKRIPVVVLSTSRAPNEVLGSYDLGANAFISKPETYEELVEILGTLGEHWVNVVTPAVSSPESLSPRRSA